MATETRHASAETPLTRPEEGTSLASHLGHIMAVAALAALVHAKPVQDILPESSPLKRDDKNTLVDMGKSAGY